ncbi:hypothetical protein ANANG_G00090540, partial [Anguilla anguilla]
MVLITVINPAVVSLSSTQLVCIVIPPPTGRKLRWLSVTGGKGRGQRKATNNNSESCLLCGRCFLLSHCIYATPEAKTLPQPSG